MHWRTPGRVGNGARRVADRSGSRTACTHRARLPLGELVPALPQDRSDSRERSMLRSRADGQSRPDVAPGIAAPRAARVGDESTFAADGWNQAQPVRLAGAVIHSRHQTAQLALVMPAALTQLRP
jgi:hypothetical protein